MKSLRIQRFLHVLYLCIVFFSYVFIFNLPIAYSQTVLKGRIVTSIEKDQILEISLSTHFNFYFSQAGDQIYGATTKNIFVGENFCIPKGSKFKGVITKIIEPGRLGKDGSFEFELNQVTTQDGTVIPVYASLSNDVRSKEEKIASVVTYDAALITFGSVHGAIAAVQYTGIPFLIASHGISALAGAGIGAGAGIFGSFFRKGKIPTILHGENSKVILKSNFYIFGELPVVSSAPSISPEYKGFRFSPSVKKDEVEINVKDVKKYHSSVYGNYVVLDFNLKNNSNKSISLSDVVLVNESSNDPIHPDLFLSGTQVLKAVKPFDELDISVAYLINKKLDSYVLSIIDPLDNEEIIRIPLEKQ